VKYLIKIHKGAMHLFKDGMFDTDLGELKKTFSGKMVTNNVFSTNYELEDISGLFSSGKKYRIKGTDDTRGVLVKESWGSSYNFIAD